MKDFDYKEFTQTHQYSKKGDLLHDGKIKVATYYICDTVDMEKLNYGNVFVVQKNQYAMVVVLMSSERERIKKYGIALEQHKQSVKALIENL